MFNTTFSRINQRTQIEYKFSRWFVVHDYLNQLMVAKNLDAFYHICGLMKRDEGQPTSEDDGGGQPSSEDDEHARDEALAFLLRRRNAQLKRAADARSATSGVIESLRAKTDTLSMNQSILHSHVALTLEELSARGKKAKLL